ncbi:MAG TPA: HD domain-containing phosphohydrolase [Gemmatimonadaceae bacterium]
MTAPVDLKVFPPAVAELVEQAQRSELAGQREIARRRYEAALYILRKGDGVAAATLIRRIARTYLDEGQIDSADDCLDAALAVSETLKDFGGVAHAMNLMAISHGQRGDLDSAERISATALVFAKTAGDNRLAAMISQNLGIAASVRGDLNAALDHYASSLVTYRAAGLRDRLGPVLNNMGLVYTQLDRLDEAHAAYDEALTHCDATGDVPNRLLALINSTNLWLARGEIDRAADLCRKVLIEATAVSDQRALAETYKHMGVIARERGSLDESERQLVAAYDVAMKREDLLLAAETAREQAILYETMDKSRDTLRALSQSHRLFTKLRAQRDLADLKRRVGRLERQFYDIVTRWAQKIESADVYTLGHCERVANYACALARDVGFDDITMFWFRIGALLHDVGKIVVPIEILNKPGRLTPDEREIMERHAPAGAELLADIDFPWDVLPMVRGHHERWDGTGYPDKLAGENIALSARITCLADVFDALTTDRPYRPGFTRDEALKMMAGDSGKLFDPELFVRFERVIRSSTLYQVRSSTPSPMEFAKAG